MSRKKIKKKKLKMRLRKTHLLIILKAAVVILILISFFVPWYHDYTFTSNNESWETDWYLQSYYVTHKNTSVNTEMRYSYPGPDNLHNASIVWNTTFYLTILTSVVAISSLLYDIKVKKPKRNIGIILELISLFCILSVVCYFLVSYPDAIAEDAKNISTQNPCITNHGSTKAFFAVISDGISGNWAPSYGYFIMIGALIIYLFIVEHRIRIALGKVYLRMVDEAERLQEAERK